MAATHHLLVILVLLLLTFTGTTTTKVTALAHKNNSNQTLAGVPIPRKLLYEEVGPGASMVDNGGVVGNTRDTWRIVVSVHFVVWMICASVHFVVWMICVSVHILFMLTGMIGSRDVVLLYIWMIYVYGIMFSMYARVVYLMYV
ncbi:hypothetical protein CTI12_AA037970 [Artemisia annua]|uniref:Transmembrane protein n=1 Tax=Artemisia annua TaxID=35608 RepID=A0A2U1QFQ7_ARTAN|nr:hypothetical protein CTI12_AA037970 [Artemisia annua]